MVFRSTILAVSLLGRLSLKSLVFGTPMWFGIGTLNSLLEFNISLHVDLFWVAHAHHGFEMYKKNGRNGAAALQAILTTLKSFVKNFSATLLIGDYNSFPAHIYNPLWVVRLVSVPPHRFVPTNSKYTKGEGGLSDIFILQDLSCLHCQRTFTAM